MPVDLETFASGDTDYIPKINSNFAQVEAAINLLQTAQTGAANAYDISHYLDQLFQSQTTLIGIGSYLPTPSGSDLLVAAGGAYLTSQQIVVQGIPTTLSFSGQPNGTYYIVPDSTGTPTRANTVSSDALYSVTWSGSVFGTVTRLARAMFDASEEDNARKSTILSTDYDSLDDRLEAVEALAKSAATSIPKKVGITLDGGGAPPSAGIKGQIQVDFDGTIVGWSCIADQAGDLSVSIAVGRSSPPAEPPADPVIPNPVTDKISASASIALSGAQSASSDAAGLTGWTTDIQKWDTIQFNLQSVATITQVTLYLRIQQS